MTWKEHHPVDDCLLEAREGAKARREDLAPNVARLDRCRGDHGVASCEICGTEGLLSTQECVFRVYNLGIRF